MAAPFEEISLTPSQSATLADYVEKAIDEARKMLKETESDGSLKRRLDAADDRLGRVEGERRVLVAAGHLGLGVDGVQVQPRHRVPRRPMEAERQLIRIKVLGPNLLAHELDGVVDERVTPEASKRFKPNRKWDDHTNE